MPPTYICRRCGRTHSPKEYSSSRFCGNCGTYLTPKNRVTHGFNRVTDIRKRRSGTQASGRDWLPDGYDVREGQKTFVKVASKALGNGDVFLGSAPCGIGKSLGSLLTVLPTLGNNKLLVSFRTRSQLHIYLKELRALKRPLSVVAFFSKQNMCPLRTHSNLSYFDFLGECRRLKENCESSTKPYCRFYANLLAHAKLKEAKKLAIECTRKILSPGEAVQQMGRQGYCAYEALKRVLDNADVFLGTYHYTFNPSVRQTLLRSFGTDLSSVYLIVDEAHNLPAFSRELLSDKLTYHTLDSAVNETASFDHKSRPSVREYLNVLLEIFQQSHEILKPDELKQLNPAEISDLFLNHTGNPGTEVAQTLHEYGEHVRTMRHELGHDRIFSYTHRVGEFLENFFTKVGTPYIHLVQRNWNSQIVLAVQSFDGREITDPVLRQARGSILMSGFLSPPSVYRDLMLYENTDVSLHEFDSPFPPENRLIVVAGDVSSQFEKRTDTMYEKWGTYIDAISQVNAGNMGVFFTSYGLMHTLMPFIHLDRTTIMEQRKTRRDKVITQLQQSADNVLFGVMGGKFSEGIDYADNLLTCAVIVGLPYASWNVYQQALISYFYSQFSDQGRLYAYLTPAILRLIQTCGRVHRSATDKGCIVILDERLARSHIKKQLPLYYQHEMKLVRNPIDCAQQIRTFWERHSRGTY